MSNALKILLFIIIGIFGVGVQLPPLFSQEIEIKASVRDDLFRDFKTFLESHGHKDNGAELASTERKIKNTKPRFEERKVGADILQLALIFPSTSLRDEFFAQAHYPTFKVVKAGSTTTEVGIKGVDKALAINFLHNHFEEIFTREGGEKREFNPFKEKTLFISDADGTIYAKPEADKDHNLFALDSSPAGIPLKSYLMKGGLAAIISGNDIYRVIDRIDKGFAEDEQDLKQRLVLFANGGSTLFTFEDGQWREYLAYRQMALKDKMVDGIDSDFLYVGDDHQREGNDFPAFQKVGRERSVCVSSTPTEYAHPLPGLEAGTAKLLQFILKVIESHKGGPLFQELSRKMLN